MALEPFHFDDLDGKQHTLPADLPTSALRAIRRLENLDAQFTLLELHGSTEAVAAVDAMPLKQGTKVLNDWFKVLIQGAKSVGESSSSSI